MKNKMRSFISLMLAISLLAGLFLFPHAATPTFTDVPSTHWAFDYVERAAKDGVTNGTGNGMYSPSKKLTRAEFVTMLMRAFYPEEIKKAQEELKGYGVNDPWYFASTLAMADKKLCQYIKADSALHEAIDALRDTPSLMEGKTTGVHDPAKLIAFMSEPITRYDMATIAAYIMKDHQIEPVEADSITLPRDMEVNGYFLSQGVTELFLLTYGHKVLVGVDDAGNFDPDGIVDRATMATIYCRLKDIIGTKPATTTPVQTQAPTPTPVQTTNPDVIGLKAPYATTSDSVVGSFSEGDVTLNIETHTAPADYWSDAPKKVQELTDKDMYNALVFTMLNREWMRENGFEDANVKHSNFNYPCYIGEYGRANVQDDPILLEKVKNLRRVSYALCLDGYGYAIKRARTFTKDAVDNLWCIVPNYNAPENRYDGNLKPILDQFTDGMSDKKKIDIILEEMCNRFHYYDPDVDGEYAGGFTWDNGKTAGVCDNYATAFRGAALASGIPCVSQSGNTNRGAHGWNLVYADGEWYIVDPTWVDTGNYPHYVTEAEYYKFSGADPYDMSDFKILVETLYDIRYND